MTISYVFYEVNCEEEASYIAYVSLKVLVFLPDDREYNGRITLWKVNKWREIVQVSCLS